MNLGCSFTNLTYNQWLHGSVLYYPLGDMDVEPINSSYTILYADYTLLKFPPEAYYYAAMSSWDYPAEVTIDNLYASLTNINLYNPKVQQDIWLNVANPMATNFISPNTVYYQRYSALNFGLGGFFAKLTPRQVIEGYYDDVLTQYSATPVYMGGDPSVDPWISTDNVSATKPANIPVQFNTGTSDYT